MEDKNRERQGESEETQREYFGRTQDGAKVYDRLDSHFHAEGGLTPDLLGAALSTINTEGRTFVREVVDFGHPIGKTSCVEIGPDDEVEMVFRKGRSGRTPMVKNRESQPCSKMMVILLKDDTLKDDNNDAYVLITSFVGDDAPREPWDPGNETEEGRKECEDFWSTHALVYDESLIDEERTEMFNQASDRDQKIELLRERTLYAGLFISPDELYSQAPATLARRIEHPHVTTSFRPSPEQLNIDQLGSSARIIATGYGNDGKNEGLLVRIEADDPAIQQACDAIPVPHITLSIAEGAQAKDTASLDFHPLDEPIELNGNYGLFVQGEVIQQKPEDVE